MSQEYSSVSTEQKSKIIRRLAIKLLLSVLIGFLFSWLFSSFLIYPVKVKNSFMTPTYPRKSTVFVTPIFSLSGLKPLDVVLYKSPYNDSLIIGRIAGIPGDKIKIMGKKAFRNGTPLEDKFTVFTDSRPPFPVSFSKRDNMDSIKVPSNQFFILADNRDEGLDSRDIGPIAYNRIIGRVLF